MSDADTVSSDEHGHLTSTLSDNEISAKLEELSGAKLGLDERTQKVVGKLLMDEKDEKVNADSSTMFKLFAMMGGFLSIFLFISQNIFFRMVDVYSDHITNEWSEITPEEQSDRFSEYMQTMAYVGLFGLVFGNIRDLVL